MDASNDIRTALTKVSALRQLANATPGLGQALTEVKAFQTQRFADTYQDLLHDPKYTACTTFFLQELYGTRNYSQRDAQFARIAGALERVFPEPVVATAVTLAQLHCLTEELDLSMAEKWRNASQQSEAARYAQAWASVGCHAQREWQLQTVLKIGRELGEFTRKRGLRLMLRMMRRPAELAGLASLQTFLESGFDNFNSIARNPDDLTLFLSAIETRESAWLEQMYKRSAALTVAA